jgi:hypothetical protein
MKKLIVIFFLLFPALVLAQDKCCVLIPGKCMPLTAATDEEACKEWKGKIVSAPCGQVTECKKPAGSKCCIQKEYEQCFGVNSPATAARCKGQMLDCPCPPQCRPSCAPQ